MRRAVFIVLSVLIDCSSLKAVQEGSHSSECHACALCHAVNGVLGDITVNAESTLYELSESAEKRSAACEEKSVVVDISNQLGGSLYREYAL